jgi:deoxyxylulose-5-phosphate synthase
MAVTESKFGFKGFSNVYPNCENLTNELARLFDKCEFDKEETRYHTISFREATERLRTAVKNSLSVVENSTNKKVSEFRIGKTSVTKQSNRTFDPMKPTTWKNVPKLNQKWTEPLDDKYDGLFEVGCVTNELIPRVIKETNTTICMDHQMYALGMAQALVHHYMVHEPDARLRNKSIESRFWSEGKPEDKGAIIYLAYKLESQNIEVSVLLFGYLNKSLANVLFSAFNHRC